jgi:hypothetical protein
MTLNVGLDASFDNIVNWKGIRGKGKGKVFPVQAVEALRVARG